MIKNIIEDSQFQELFKKQCKELIEFIVSKDIEFDIVVNIKDISFQPDLPSSIKDRLNKFSLFSLAGYTFKTLHIKENNLYFEAGFGKDNFGSLVEIPFGSIFQIVKDDNIIYLNLSATLDNKNPKENSSKDKSMNIFKNNPNNKRFK